MEIEGDREVDGHGGWRLEKEKRWIGGLGEGEQLAGLYLVRREGFAALRERADSSRTTSRLLLFLEVFCGPVRQAGEGCCPGPETSRFLR